MKFTTRVNLIGIHRYGFTHKTDLDDWMILDYVNDWSCSLYAKRLGDFVWINLNTALQEMPILRVNTKSGLSRKIKNLIEIGLLEGFQDETDKRLFLKLTPLFYEVAHYREGI